MPDSPVATRRVAAILTLAALLCGQHAALAAEPGLKEARQQLRETRDGLHRQSERLADIQDALDRLATKMAIEEEALNETEEATDRMADRVDAVETRLQRLQERLNERNREAFIQGPGAPMLFLLTATSANEAAMRMSILTEMNRRDAVLAAEVKQADERLDRLGAELARLERAQTIAMQQLQIHRHEVDRRMRRARELFTHLRHRRDAILDEISRYRPFAFCPVDGPHAISDSFGIFVHRSPARGGDHVHQGVDIMAADGTPILAPFDGVAVSAANAIGGEAVKVFGEYGYVYNAHLSRYGTLGRVEAGDVIGFVGSTGNALGPHDHFEWHPANGDAVDPYPFLLMVC
jgi:murein DD-endopeptidase MepM/ murein hydrolase activator NlpD